MSLDFDPQRISNSQTQRLRDLIATTSRYDLAKLSLERERLETWRAIVDVSLDGCASLDREVAVEIHIESLQRTMAIAQLELTARIRLVVHLMDLISSHLFARVGTHCSRFGIGKQPVGLGKCIQQLLELLSSPMQPTHHRADRNIKDLGDLLVGETLDIGQ